MIGHLERIFSNICRGLSRSEWGIRLAGLSKSTGTEMAPGLVMIQVDGLSRTQLEAALQRGKMPFLSRLINQEGYRLHTHFPGVPTSTPAIQGGIILRGQASCPRLQLPGPSKQKNHAHV